MIQQVIREWVKRAIGERFLAREYVGFDGRILWREVPFATREEFEHWWLPERDTQGKIIQQARMSERERDHYTVAEDHNILTVAGRAQILSFIGTPAGGVAAFGQYFAVGNFPINSLDPNDTIVQGEFFRAVPSTGVSVGTQIDLATYIGATQGNGVYSNVGLYGVSATATPFSGVLMTHAKSTYTKVNLIPVVADYLINLT